MIQSINLKVFKEFVKSSNFGGLLLFLCVILSLIIANTSLSENLQNILDYKFGIENDYLHLNYSTSMWINDGLMAVFFLLVGLEIKRERLLKGNYLHLKKQ